MKRHIFNTFILGFAIASCTDPFMGQTATDHVAPGPIKNAKVINLEGVLLSPTIFRRTKIYSISKRLTNETKTSSLKIRLRYIPIL